MEPDSACPECGARRQEGALDSLTCGIVFAKYRGPEMTASRDSAPVTHAEVVARRIDDEFVWLGRCSRQFLASLPEAPRSI